VIFRPGGTTGFDRAGRASGEVNNLEGFPHSQAPIGRWARRGLRATVAHALTSSPRHPNLLVARYKALGPYRSGSPAKGPQVSVNGAESPPNWLSWRVAAALSGAIRRLVPGWLAVRAVNTPPGNEREKRRKSHSGDAGTYAGVSLSPEMPLRRYFLPERYRKS